MVSSTPTARTISRRAGSSISGRPCTRTAFIAAVHDTPNRRAWAATEEMSSPTERQISAAARTVNSPLAAIAGEVSDHVRVPQSGSGQRQIRFAQHNTTGRPDTGRSRTRTRRRPCPTARTPHVAQPATSAVVCTTRCHSPATSRWAPTTKPGMPISAVAPALPLNITEGPPSCSL